MRSQPLDLIGGFYQDDSLPWACQDTVNWIPEAAEAQGTRTPSILRDAPGLRPKVQVGTGPIRGMRNVEGKLLVVSGTQLYQVTNDLVAIPRGNIPGTGRVSMAHNSRNGGNQVVIVNGNAGYVYDTNALTLTRITDAGYPGAFVVDFVDGYMAQIEPLRRYWFHSELTQALDYNTLDRYPAEGQPDALVTLLVDHREVWVFGERTIEPFVNTGALTNTFARASNTVIENGCSAKFSPAKLDNSIFWLDDLGIVRRAQGYTATRISTSAIESAIADLDWSRAFGFTVTQEGHAIYYLTFPDGYTFGYDITTGLWHRRASYGLDRWRVSAIAYWNGAYICGDFQQGLLYALDWKYPYDGELPHVRRRVTGVTHDNQTKVLVPYAELIVDNGRALVASDSAPAQPDAPTITGDAPNGVMGSAYSYAYTLAGGTPPYVVSLRSGTLPPGLTLSAAGILSGTPTLDGTYTWTVRNTDSTGLYDDLDDGNEIASDSILVTNYNFYTGNPATLAVAATDCDFTKAFSRVRISPNGQYVAGIDRSGSAPVFELAKFAAGVWTSITAPSVTAGFIPGDVAWHPSGNYLAATYGGGATAAQSIVIYKRAGDTFTAIAFGATAPDAQCSTLAWNPAGTRLAVQQAFSGARVLTYDFDTATDTVSNRRDTPDLGVNDNDFTRLSFDATGDYIACGGATRLVALAATEASIRAAVIVIGASNSFGQGLHWKGDYLVTMGDSGDKGRVYAFTRTAGSEALTLSSNFAVQPTSTPLDMSASFDGRYLAIGNDVSTAPQIYDLSTAIPPVATKLTSPASAGGVVSTVSWGPLYE